MGTARLGSESQGPAYASSGNLVRRAGEDTLKALDGLAERGDMGLRRTCPNAPSFRVQVARRNSSVSYQSTAVTTLLAYVPMSLGEGCGMLSLSAPKQRSSETVLLLAWRFRRALVNSSTFHLRALYVPLYSRTREVPAPCAARFRSCRCVCALPCAHLQRLRVPRRDDIRVSNPRPPRRLARAG